MKRQEEEMRRRMEEVEEEGRLGKEEMELRLVRPYSLIFSPQNVFKKNICGRDYRIYLYKLPLLSFNLQNIL